LKGACAAAYANPAVHWLLGGELHPGGERTTRRALQLIRARPGERLVDVASGTGVSTILAAREFGCVAAGVDYSPEAVRAAQEMADAHGLCDRVGFVQGDAEALPFAECSFDVALCECSLCTFPERELALAELRRVLRTGGRAAITDVVGDDERLSEGLRGAMARVACLGATLSTEGYQRLIEQAGFELLVTEDRDADAAALAQRVEDRLRGARLLGWGDSAALAGGIEEAIELTRLARQALAEGTLGYAIFAAVRR
jgi:ubiquinone/menaquinone biosynthesis C-methylase UbiE